MALAKTTINHVESFDVISNEDMANQATREIMTTTFVAKQAEIEGFMFMNSRILSGAGKGASYNSDLGRNTVSLSTSVNPQSVATGAPAGSFRAALTPKGNGLKELVQKRSAGDVKYKAAAFDSVTFEIDQAMETDITIISPLDQGGWLYSEFESAINIQVLNDMVYHLNYKLHQQWREAALLSLDPFYGKSHRVYDDLANKTPEEYTHILIDAIAAYNALPNDRYVAGFDDDELAIGISRVAQANLLKEKLVIFDGQFTGEAGKFFNGLPYSHLFAGVPAKVSKYIVAPNQAAEDQIDWFITTIGQWGAMFFDVPWITALAEKQQGMFNTLGIYGGVLYGMKIPTQFRPWVSVGMQATATKPWEDNNLHSYRRGESTTTDFRNYIVGEWGSATHILVRTWGEGEAMPGWTSTALSGMTPGDEITLWAQNLTPNTQYVTEIALSTDGVSPMVDTSVNGQNEELIVRVNNKTL